MCGRIGYSISREDLLKAYPWLRDAPDLPARYNVAPTDPLVVVGPSGADEVSWGIDGRRGGLFNLRADTALKRGLYRGLLLGSRVVVPASHFYEWPERRRPVAVHRTDGGILHLAGLLGRRADDRAVTIITTEPNATVAALHDRMPVVLSDDDAATWVLEELGIDQLAAMLRPCPVETLTAAPASPLVNDVRNDGPHLLDPDALPAQHQLDLMR
jgi:putative SOS response-associated peptidase YedK